MAPTFRHWAPGEKEAGLAGAPQVFIPLHAKCGIKQKPMNKEQAITQKHHNHF